MREYRLRNITILFFTIMLMGFSPFCKNETKEIKIGALLPLTGDGAKYGEEAQRGIDLAVSQSNAGGGIRGNSIRVIYEDDLGTQPGAVNGFNKLITIDKVPIVIGAMYSSTTLAVAPIAEKNKVVLFSPSASSPEITKSGDYIFRNWPSDIYEGGEMARFVFRKLGLQKVAIITVNVDYGIGLVNVFKKFFEELGGQIAAIEKYDKGATDFRTQLTKIKMVQPPAIYLPGYYTEIALLLKQAKEIGFKTQFISCVGFDNPKSLEIAGDSAEGVIFARPTFDPESREEKVINFVQIFKRKYGVLPGTYAAHAYDALNIVVEAFKKDGSSSDGLKNALYSIKNFSGVTGNTSFDNNGDVIKSIQIVKVKNLKFENYE